MNKILKLLLITNIFTNGGKKNPDNLNIKNNIIINKKIPIIPIRILKNNLIKQFREYNIYITLEELKYIEKKDILNIILKKFNPLNLLQNQGYDISNGLDDEMKEFLNIIYNDIYLILFNLNKSPFINKNFKYETILKKMLKQDLIVFDNLYNIINFLNESPLKDNLKKYSIILNKILKKNIDLDSFCKIINYLNKSPLKDNLKEYNIILNIILLEPEKDLLSKLHVIINNLNQVLNNKNHYNNILNKIILKNDELLNPINKIISQLNKNNKEENNILLDDILDNNYNIHQLENIILTLKNGNKCEFNKNLKDTLNHIKKI